jgi:hypothetical protein
MVDMGELVVLVEREELGLDIRCYYRDMYNHCEGLTALSSEEQEPLHF